MPTTLPVSYTSVNRVWLAAPSISSVTNITSEVQAQFAGDVESEINAIISKRYSIPLSVDCPILTAIATRETIYRTMVQRLLIQFPPVQQGSHPLQVQHKDDQKLLEKIAEGDYQLTSASGDIIAADITQMEIYSTTMEYLPTFHEGDWGSMTQDQTKLDDIDSERDT